MKTTALKLRAYETVYRLNRAFELVRLNLDRLEALGLFRRNYLKSFRNMAEELRAETNHELTEKLNEREERDWAHFGQLCNQWEKKFRDPNDVLIEAERLRKQARQRQTK